MDTDIDQALARIGAQDTHPDLSGLEDRVLARIGARPKPALALGTTLGAAMFALALGVMSNTVPTGEARAATLAPFGAPSPLAPSSLLLGSQ